MIDAKSREREDAPARFGKAMVFGAWILTLAMLTLLFNAWLEVENNPNTALTGRTLANGISEVSLKKNRAGHYVAGGKINGYPVVFLIDTGATDVALSGALADRLGLRKGAPTTSFTANGATVGFTTRLDSVELGGIRQSDVRATVLPRMADAEVLLGMSFLKRLELVQRDGTLTLRTVAP